MDIKEAFGLALKKARNSKKLTQEEFSEISSRTYISSLERGKKSITLEKMEDISTVLNIHPLTLMFLTYSKPNENINFTELIELINNYKAKFKDESLKIVFVNTDNLFVN